MVFKRYTISSGAIDADGAATAYSGMIRGKIVSVYVDYPAANCTVDLDEADATVSQKVLDLAAANTDAIYYPRVAVHDVAGTGVTFDGTNEIYEPFTVFGRLKLTIGGGTEGQSVTVTILAEE